MTGCIDVKFQIWRKKVLKDSFLLKNNLKYNMLFCLLNLNQELFFNVGYIWIKELSRFDWLEFYSKSCNLVAGTNDGTSQWFLTRLPIQGNSSLVQGFKLADVTKWEVNWNRAPTQHGLLTTHDQTSPDVLSIPRSPFHVFFFSWTHN